MIGYWHIITSACIYSGKSFSYTYNLIYFEFELWNNTNYAKSISK